jgi:hypothetical protein
MMPRTQRLFSRDIFRLLQAVRADLFLGKLDDSLAACQFDVESHAAVLTFQRPHPRIQTSYFSILTVLGVATAIAPRRIYRAVVAKRHVELTTSGRLFLEEARSILAHVALSRCSTILGLVAAGIGLTLLPLSVDHRYSGVVFRTLAEAARLEIALAWRAHNDSALIQKFRQTIRESIKTGPRKNGRS